MKIHINTRGFAHPLLLMVALVGIVGLLGFAGLRVLNRANEAKQQEVTSAVPNPILITSNGDTSSSSDSKPTKISISRTGSAAAEASQQPANNASGETLPETKQFETKYDVSTPIGSLSQMILDAKAKRFSNVLYFITPRLMFRTYDVLKSQNLSELAQSCQSNSSCKSLLITDVEINENDILVNDCYGESYTVECKEVSTKFTIQDGKFKTAYYKNVGYHIHSVHFYMLRYNGEPNWVLDKVQVDDYTL